ncbi:Ras-like protein gene family, member A [Pancytospora philotis]|nr:Ras-like protein gene family, member A [Pancytospora philotis]
MSQVVTPESAGAADKQESSVAKKLTIIGRGECGKTCILRRLVYGTFSETLPATPIESETVDYSVNGLSINLKIFDTSGQDEYSRFRTLTLPVSDYVLVCYSITDRASFKEVEDTLVSMVAQKAPAHAKTILVATKMDCMDESHISSEEGKLLRERIGAAGFFECSSFTGQGIHEIFDFIKNDIYLSANKEPSGSSSGFFARVFGCCS